MVFDGVLFFYVFLLLVPLKLTPAADQPGETQARYWQEDVLLPSLEMSMAQLCQFFKKLTLLKLSPNYFPIGSFALTNN